MQTECIKCKGTGSIMVTPKVHPVTKKLICDIPCVHCSSTGKLNEEQVKYIQNGIKIRTLRMKEMMTAREMADCLSVDLIEYMNCESGIKNNEEILLRMSGQAESVVK